ncbi:hypothetical protein ES705_41370 [subsurface metagenome]
MDAKRIVSARISDSAYLQAKEDAAENDMSLSEWIEDCINGDFEDSPNAEDIINMDWDEKVNVIDEYTLDIDPDDYENDDDFAEAVIDELGLDYPSDYENPGSLTWIIIVAIVGFFAWLGFSKPKQLE